MQEIAAIRGVVLEHAENAAFLWLRRRNEVEGQAFGEVHLGRLDQRLTASLLGLSSAGRAGWRAALDRYGDYPEAGEVFVLGALALQSGEATALDAAWEAGLAAGPEGAAGLSGAVARADPAQLRGLVAPWLASAQPPLRRLGVCALSHHRIGPGPRLDALLVDPDAGVRARALRLIGELGLLDRLPAAQAALGAETEEERFWAAWSSCVLGGIGSAGWVLAALVAAGSERTRAAIEIGLLAGDPTAGRRWLRDLIARPETRAAAIAQVGVPGDRGVMPWLIDCMRDPARAAPAGMAFRDLYEIDFDDTDLFSADPAVLGEAFADAEGGPSFPVADRVAAWWDEGRRTHAEAAPSLRHLRLRALRGAIAAPGRPLPAWRRTRRFPAWM